MKEIINRVFFWATTDCSQWLMVEVMAYVAMITSFVPDKFNIRCTVFIMGFMKRIRITYLEGEITKKGKSSYDEEAWEHINFHI
ncbi:hypothetical protein P8452_77904 [Trifolium repens]|nr:hypothetical protein P8452_77904 [Trifolium repens]